MKNKRYLIPLLIVPTIMLSACKLFNFGSKKTASITFHKYSNQVSYEQFMSSLQIVDLVELISDRLYSRDSFVFTHREITDTVNNYDSGTEKNYLVIDETKSYNDKKTILETDYYSKETYETPTYNSEKVNNYLEQLIFIGGAYYRVNKTSKIYYQIADSISIEIFDISAKISSVISIFIGATTFSKAYIDDEVYTLCYEKGNTNQGINEQYICQIEQEKDQIDFRFQINSESAFASDYNSTSEYAMELTIKFTNPNIEPIDYQDFIYKE